MTFHVKRFSIGRVNLRQSISYQSVGTSIREVRHALNQSLFSVASFYRCLNVETIGVCAHNKSFKTD